MMLDLTREQLVTLQNGLGLALFQSFGLPDEVKYRELLSIVTKAILDTYPDDRRQEAKEKVATATNENDQFQTY